ncbi:MAG: glycosyltransferase family 2 protein [bacterium]
MKKKVSIVIPARDEEKSISLVLTDLMKIIDSLKEKYDFEVIVVDDHSQDETAGIAKKFGDIVIRNEASPGKGNALRCGFQKAHGQIFIMMDADYSHRPEEVPAFLRAIERGAGLVIGSRALGGSEEYTAIRTVGNIFLTGCVNLLFGTKLTDSLNGYKGFRREVFTKNYYNSESFEIEIEIIANSVRMGMGIVEIVSRERARKEGKAKSSVIIHGTKFLLRIIKESMRYKFPRNYMTKKRDA